jgi:hypothetical protein
MRRRRSATSDRIWYARGLTTSYAKYRGVVSTGPLAPYPAGGIMTTAGDVGHCQYR